MQVTGDANVPAGKLAFSSWAAPLPEPWQRVEAELVAYRQQLANFGADDDAPPLGAAGGGEAQAGVAEPQGRPPKRVHLLQITFGDTCTILQITLHLRVSSVMKHQSIVHPWFERSQIQGLQISRQSNASELC